MGRSAIRRAVAAVAIAILTVGAPAVALAGTSHRGAATKVTVTLTDRRLTVSPSGAEAGPTTLNVVNKGTKPRVLVVAGPGIKAARTSRIRAGGRATLTLTLRIGAYMLSDGPAFNPASSSWLLVTPVSQAPSNDRTVTPMPSSGNGGMYCD